MRQDQDIWLINLKQGADIKLNRARKNHEMKLQLDIYKGVPMGKSQNKAQEDYEALAQGHGEIKKGLPQPKGGISAWLPNEKIGSN